MGDEADRSRLRRLQDRIIEVAERNKYAEDMRVSVDMPADVTLATLRSYVYVPYEAELRAVLFELTGEDR